MDRNLKITILGDILCDFEMSKRLSLYQNPQGQYDFHSVFAPLQPFLAPSDIVIANLETPISIDNQNLTNSQWQFFSPFEFAQAVHNCGVKCVSTANNHCLDRGISGIESTINSLDKIGLYHFGTRLPSQAAKPFTYSFAGVKLGLLAFTYGTNAVSNHEYLNWKNHRIVDLLQEQEGWFDKWNLWKKYAQKRPGGRVARLYQKASHQLHPENVNLEWFEQHSFDFYRKHLAREQIKHLKQEKCDLILAQIHVGGQYNERPSPYTKNTVSWFLNQGCNVVVGNHEHVIHNFDLRNNTMQIGTYAIGNCLGSAGTFHPPYDRCADHSIALHLYLDTDTKQISKYTFSVLQTVKNADGTLCVWPSFDYLQFCTLKEKEKQTEQLLKAAELFTGNHHDTIKSEYLIFVS